MSSERERAFLNDILEQVSNPIRQKAPNIPWSSLAGMRNKLIHEYFGVNLDIV